VLAANNNVEGAALRASILGSAFMAVLGLGFAFYTSSGAVLLDGFFSLINLAMSLVTLRVAALVNEPADQRFQFGYAGFEPMLNVIKGLISLLVCGFALASAVSSLLGGGRLMDLGWGVVYAVIATLGCFLIAALQARSARRTDSPLLEVEARSWRIDGYLSLAVALGFGVGYLATGSRFEPLLPYVDPALVILLVAFAAPIPMKIVSRNVGELLLGAPPEEAQAAVRERVEAVTGQLPVSRTEIRMIKVGRQRAALVYVLVEPGTALEGIEELDEVRQRITDELATLQPSWVVDVLFVAHERWMS
jgi:cation diffusion facilitator family transporter